MTEIKVTVLSALDPVAIKFPAKESNGKEKQYRLTRDLKQNAIYTEVGELDVNEYVNSFEAGCSLQSILERVALLPARDKIAYLQQSNGGVSADLTSIPKDGTAAFILLNRVRDEHPDIYARFAAGESFETILKSILPNEEAAPASEAGAESEVNNG